MPLKLSKVEKLLLDNRLLITCFYLLGHHCLFLKVFSIDKGHSFLVKVDEELNLVIKRETLADRPNINVLYLNPISEDPAESTIEKYGKIPDNAELKNIYDINFQKSDFSDKELEANLESNYKKKIYLNDLDKVFKHRHRDCARQIKRLSLSFTDIRYMLSMVYENVLVYSDEKSKIQSFLIPEQNTEGCKILFIVVKLDFFFEDKETIINDVISIKKSLFDILDRTADTNTTNLFLLLKKFDSIGETLAKFNNIKATQSSYLQQLEKLLGAIVAKEKDVLDEIYSLEESYEKGNMNEVTFVHSKRSLEEKKEKSIAVKQKILKNINNVLNRYDSIYLKCDKVEFDNTILIDTLQKNIKEMEEEIEKNVEV